MSTLIGLFVVMASVLGGFAMTGGPFSVLFQPNELLIIGGAALGSLIIGAPGKVLARIRRALGHGFRIDVPNKKDYLDLLKLLHQLFTLARREGMLALEAHATSPRESQVLRAHPSLLRRKDALEFLTDGLKQLVDGCTPDELAMLFEVDLETREVEEHQPINLIRITGDALPGLGIVAAVLGIIVTMGHLDAGPEQIGHHVAAALVGTFLGILLCYGMLGPIATSIEMQAQANAKYLQCIKEGLLAAARGASPVLAVEFARRAIFSDERPSVEELDRVLHAERSAGGSA